MLYKFKGYSPQAMHQPWDGWVADSATVLGQVELGQQVSVWFGAVIRADNSYIPMPVLRCQLGIMSPLDIRPCCMVAALVITA